MGAIRILFDGPPSHDSGRFVEVEDATGKSISVGTWKQEGRYWVLEIHSDMTVRAELAEIRETAQEIYRHYAGSPNQVAALKKLRSLVGFDDGPKPLPPESQDAKRCRETGEGGS